MEGSLLVCPFCNETMETGYIKSYGESIFFTPDKARKNNFFTGKDNVVLVKGEMFGTSSVVSYYCRSCNKCIIDNNTSNT